MAKTIGTTVVLTVDENKLTVRQMVRTDCCGARYFKDIAPDFCTLCGEKIDTNGRVLKERNLDHLVAQGGPKTRRLVF